MSASAKTYNKILTKGSLNAVEHTNVEDGKFRVATDTSDLFIDIGSTRHHISDFITSYTEANITGGYISSPNPKKFYMSSDTFKVFRYDSTEEEFKTISAGISISTSGDGNAVTGVTNSNGTLVFTKGSTFLTEHPDIETDDDTTNTAAVPNGGTFTAVDSITRDSNGHVTEINLKTVSIPLFVFGSATTAGNTTQSVNNGNTIIDDTMWDFNETSASSNNTSSSTSEDTLFALTVGNISGNTVVDGSTWDFNDTVNPNQSRSVGDGEQTRDGSGSGSSGSSGNTYVIPTVANVTIAGNIEGGNSVIDNSEWDFGLVSA